MALFKCPECDNLISTQSKSCTNCGFDVQKYVEENGNMIQCNQCWHINSPDSTKCSNCGNNLQYSNRVCEGLPENELDFDKKNEEDRKVMNIVIAVFVAILLFFIFIFIL